LDIANEYILYGNCEYEIDTHGENLWKNYNMEESIIAVFRVCVRV
jgi:hypothetical protein